MSKKQKKHLNSKKNKIIRQNNLDSKPINKDKLSKKMKSDLRNLSNVLKQRIGR